MVGKKRLIEIFYQHTNAIALILGSESLVCMCLRAADINIAAFLLAPGKSWFQDAWLEIRSTVSKDTDPFSSSIVPILLIVFRSLKYV